MKVSQAIEMLQTYNQDEEICISWWCKDLFNDGDLSPISDEAWDNAVKEFDNEEGYQHINSTVWELLHNSILGIESGTSA
jgi:hypothetical protein